MLGILDENMEGTFLGVYFEESTKAAVITL
jgi:hypothetical protein